MLPDDALLWAAWAVLFVVLLAVVPRLLPQRLRAPEPQLQREDRFFEIDGPVSDLEAALIRGR